MKLEYIVSPQERAKLLNLYWSLRSSERLAAYNKAQRKQRRSQARVGQAVEVRA